MARLLAALCAALLLAVPAAQAWDSYPEIDETASWLSQRPVKVRCLTEAETAADFAISLWGASAYVLLAPDGGPEDYTVFEYGLCERLHALYTQTWYGTYTLRGVAWALLVIVHESGHMRGHGQWWKDEGKVNRWAIRHVRYAALHMFPNEHISYLLRDRARQWCEGQPDEYRTYGCEVGT